MKIHLGFLNLIFRKIGMKRYININLQLPNEKLIQIINSLKEYLFVQSVHEDSYLINCENVFHYKSNFREACSLLNISELYFGTHGGLSHAAAALK